MVIGNVVAACVLILSQPHPESRDMTRFEHLTVAATSCSRRPINTESSSRLSELSFNADIFDSDTFDRPIETGLDRLFCKFGNWRLWLELLRKKISEKG